jgi:hypothetical protein
MVSWKVSLTKVPKFAIISENDIPKSDIPEIDTKGWLDDER